MLAVHGFWYFHSLSSLITRLPYSVSYLSLCPSRFIRFNFFTHFFTRSAVWLPPPRTCIFHLFSFSFLSRRCRHILFLWHFLHISFFSHVSLCTEGSLRLIAQDLPRTFPELAFFHGDGPLAQSLQDVLEAYVCYRPDVGYVQGMSYLAAILLLYMDDFTAFQCFANLLSGHFYFDFYRLHRDKMMVRPALS